jgi:ATP-dependent DNA helicase RecG
LHESAAVSGRIVAQGIKTWRQGTRSLFEIILEDGTGRLHCRWWNLPYLEQYFHVGDTVLAHGKVVSLRPRAMDHPETEVIEQGEETSIHLGRIVPVYPLAEGLSQRWLRSLIWHALAQTAALVTEPWPGLVEAGYLSRRDALEQVHYPAELAEGEAGRRRLALDEFIALQVPLQRRRRNLQLHARGRPCAGDNHLIRPLLAHLGFTLTEAQTRVLREIRRDLAGPHPMRRLLQGDVGSGKTIVAACAALMTLESGFDVALMAPTEIVAEQHERSFVHWFSPLGVAVVLRTGSRITTTAPRAESGRAASDWRRPPAAGAKTPPALFLGTHALLEPGFAPDNLGLVIIDEQHKFGVAQREELVRKGAYPHLLVMTATPIPRTLGLTLYGDLEVSVIDALPAGRGRVRTFVRTAASLPRVWAFVGAQLGAGRQAYVVYPRLEEGDAATGLKAVKEEFGRVQASLAPHRVGLVHGQQAAAEKEQVMADFRANRLQALVATSVIEVGVDVPNATVMVVENAEVFGLAQLHQLRGRIGRGSQEAYCILVAAARTAKARQRLQVLERIHDGFAIAEADLALRGPGELLGQAQSGLPSFRFGDLVRDLDLIDAARDQAARIVATAESPGVAPA